jgi:hypothetical protein
VVNDKHVFADEAVRGRKSRRAGLEGLRQALASGEIDVLLVLTTNRLFRKTYKSLQFVEEEVVDRRLRCVFVMSGVDTDDRDRWRQLLHVHAMVDEAAADLGAVHIRAAHEGLFENGFVWGTLAFGYTGEDVPGSSTNRGRPRQKVMIDAATSVWVCRIFEWYAIDELSIAECVRKLNGLNAPLPPKCTTGAWTRMAVRIILSNPCYRGDWAYGRTEAVWQNRADYVRQIPRDQPLRTRQIEALRIVGDELWYAAQQRLATDMDRRGRPAKHADRRRRPELLNGLFYCKAHGRRMHVGGSYGRYYLCPECQQLPDPPLVTLLNRELAVAAVCETCAGLLRNDAELADKIVASCRDAARDQQQPDPRRLQELRTREGKISGRIKFILENPGEADVDQRENAEALRHARAERAKLRTAIARHEAAATKPMEVPSRCEVEGLIERLASILERAAQSSEDEDLPIARKIVRMITGGKIVVTQMGEPKRKRGWLQGTFVSRLFPYLLQQSGFEPRDGSAKAVVVVDFRKPSSAEQMAHKVKALFDEGLLIKEIAARLRCSRNLIPLALAHSFGQRGQQAPDGRTRRSTLERKSREAPKYKRLASRAKALADQGLLLQEIAAKLNCDRNTVTKAMRYAFSCDAKTAPDGRTRRRSLTRKTSKPVA